MAFEKSNQKMCKLMAIIGCILSKVTWIRHLGEGKMDDVMMYNVSMNDVMIAATFHWLMLAMWHVNHVINSHVID